MSNQTGRPSRTFAAVAASLLLLLSLAPPTRARQQGGAERPAPQSEDDAQEQPSPGQPGKKGAGLLASLNLSPEQREQIREIRRQTERDARPLLQRLRRARRALDEAIYSEATDENALDARVREFTSAQADVTRLRAFTEMRVRRVLTPEQLNTLRELRRQALLRQRELRRNAQGARPAPREDLNPRGLQRGLDAPAAEPGPTPAPRQRPAAAPQRRP